MSQWQQSIQPPLYQSVVQDQCFSISDVTAFISHSPLGFQQLIDAMIDIYNHTEVKINTKKTKILKQTTPSSHNFHVENTNLSSTLANSYHLTEEIQYCIQISSATFEPLSKCVFHKWNFTSKNKSAVYKTVNFSTLFCKSWGLYSFHLWTNNSICPAYKESFSMIRYHMLKFGIIHNQWPWSYVCWLTALLGWPHHPYTWETIPVCAFYSELELNKSCWWSVQAIWRLYQSYPKEL